MKINKKYTLGIIMVVVLGAAIVLFVVSQQRNKKVSVQPATTTENQRPVFKYEYDKKQRPAGTR